MPCKDFTSIKTLRDSSILLFILTIFLSGCATVYNPATQRKETLFIDTQSEVELGRGMDKQIQNKLKILNSPALQYRLDYIGSKVASVSDRADLVYNFRIVKDKELNAFALPGGFIYVNSALMDVSTDDELACVVAHEIGHIAARHSVKRLQTVMGYQIILSLALGISGKENMAQALDIVFNLISSGYSRKDELLADKLSVKYAKKAGYNPYGMITFFKKLQQEEKKSGQNFNLAFLSSHPPIDERIKNIENEIAINP